jgi:hypothetical protein
MKITTQKLSWFSQLGEQLIEFADLYAKARYNETGAMYISSVNTNSISFRLEWATGCMGCYDSHELDFDISFDMLSSPNWRQKLQEEIDVANAKAKAAEEAEILRRKMQREANEQLEYLRLKQKYE